MLHEDLTVLVPTGDLVLDIRHEEGGRLFSYRVDSNALRQTSRYFDRLLSNRFSEGVGLSASHTALIESGKYATIADAPPEVLFRVSIIDIGRISKVSTIQQLAADFFRILHGLELTKAATPPPLANLANLAVVADRFDAIAAVSQYVLKKKYLQTLDAKKSSKGRPQKMGYVEEERARQKLFVGLFFDHPLWVAKSSSQLILRNSARWSSPDAPEEEYAGPLWWDLPDGVEDELMQRREYILETINSLQSHFLKLYSSRERQCRLGYDSSVQCDSFQLGEMVRFCVKAGTLRLQGTIYDTEEEPHQYMGDIDRLLEALRQCSSYQIDRNHAHCGLRVRLLPLLDWVQNCLGLEAGICLECWKQDRPSYAWSTVKRPVLWTRPRRLENSRSIGIFKGKYAASGELQANCRDRHGSVREMFTAADRMWTEQTEAVGLRNPSIK
jgi:hypothetical protein